MTTSPPERSPEPDFPAAPNPEREEASARHFAGAHDDFGLTPKPRVRAQRVDPLLGVDLGGVKIVKLIGEGGMGRVYEAIQEKPARTVAVKVIRAGITSEKTMRRFEKEAEYLGKLQHPGIAQIHMVGTYSSDIGDVPFYVMEFLADAKPITNYAHEQGLALEEKLRLFKLVCEAVSHGHDRGIVHRDLKPGNILVDGHGSPKVIDFGVARSTDSDLTLESMRTDSGQLVGTIQYMSPEQFGPDPDDLDGRADVYSLGVVLYELLSGSPPYSVKKKALHEASRVVCEQVPALLRLVNRTIPRDVSAIAERCLQKDRSRRYHTAGELAADIGRFLGGQPVRAKSSGLNIREIPRSLTENKTRSAVMLAALALVCWLFAGRVFNITPAPAQPAAVLPTNASPTGALAVIASEQPQQVQKIQQAQPPKEPQVALFEASSGWTKSGLIVREGDCYRITVTGECTDSTGRTFTPDGPTPRHMVTLLGAPKVITDNQTHWEFFNQNLPRQMLTGKIGDAAVIMAIGSGLTFIAPSDGELAFRFNDRQLGDEDSRGKLAIELTPVPEPPLVSQDGTTTIITRVGEPKYLVFEPDGLRWKYPSMLSGDEDDYPTLINGVAWWPERDVRAVTTSKLLKTKLFSWAAGPEPITPKVVLPAQKNSPHAEVSEGPSRGGTQSLRFSDPETGVSEIFCVISRP
jgi:serine/threonine protein kinase